MIEQALAHADEREVLGERLHEILGAEGLLRDEESRRLHSADLFGAGGLVAAVIRPASIAELSAAAAEIARAGLVLLPRGGGLTYVQGYVSAEAGAVAVDMRRMNRILDIDAQDMLVTVEAGVTWMQIYEALKPLGLRLPFFGTFSGRGATVGGGLSNGALFLGTARYGTSAEIVLGMQVVLADGSILHTGQTAIGTAKKSFTRTFGPDTTGLFTHDAGALGIKGVVTLRMIRAPAFTDYLSFGFQDRDVAVETLCEIGRSELAEDCYMMDPDKTRQALSQPGDFIRDAKTLMKVVSQEKGLLRGFRAGAQLAMAGRDFVEAGCHSLHMVLAGRTREAVEGDMALARAIVAKAGGKELPNSIPRAGRADPYSPLDAVLGATGDRWIALNAKVAHSEAKALVDAVEELIARHQAALDASGVVVSRLLTVIGNHVFSYEPVFNWHDSWLPIHHASVSAGMKARVPEPAADTDARAVVMQVRTAIVALFAEMGAQSNQIGRTYRYADIMRPESRALLAGIKRLVDPDNRVNPGALGLGR
ncbi:FAD-binding oxidoreductase [Sphingomonas solaris]|uniref:FAD-binding oxidoreductase n=1 Tax=Alterirhizorhabdus solaris TaxID=2529389 RepID=A0A558RAX0_9SPHN|nr:FAD-binding oxidoreductase [Sphingomonas solaris]TVV76549.1 FAD-binding oxidoreductase [Sphingomonas solaris]